ncbi:MAG: phosphoribosyltransferase family protein [Patescibacteria group bacterium]
MARKRSASRGFNQSQVIAKVIAKRFGLKMQPHILMRSKETAPQYTLGKYARLKNMDAAFRVCKDVKGKKILLVDDICTSGSTLISASNELYLAGAKVVECFALSKKL